MPPRRVSPSGFTLVELLVSIAVIGALAALLLPALQTAREAARRTKCQNNLRQIGLALHNYHAARREFPVGCLDRRSPATNPQGRQLAWSATTISFLERSNLRGAIDFSRSYDDPANRAAAATVVPTYLCPSATRLYGDRTRTHVGGEHNAAATDYGGLYGAAFTSPSANGVLLYDRAVRLREITDGASHTLVVAEDTGRDWSIDGAWINGENVFDQGPAINRTQHNEMYSDHHGGVFALRCDGGVEFINETIQWTALQSLLTRAGQETTP